MQGPFNKARAPPRMAFSMSPSKPPSFLLDPTLPPPPPIRTNSSFSLSKDCPTTGGSTPTAANITYSIPFGYGGMGVAPLSVVTKSSGIGSLSSSGGTGGQSTGASTPPTGEPLRESSSTARFKEMIKRNVGLSTPTATTNSAFLGPGGVTASTNSSPTVGATGSLLAPNGGSKTTSMSTGAIGDLISGDEQPSMFSVSRMTGRKKKLTKKAPNEGGSPLTDEDDIPLSMRDPKLKGQQLQLSSRHHRFMPHLPRHHTHHEHQLYPQLRGQEPVGRPDQPIICKAASQALREAQESNLDPNMLVAELEPLPAKFVEAMTGLSGESPRNTALPPSVASTMQSTTSVAAANLMMFPLIPMMASIIPSSSMGSNTGSIHSSIFASAQQEKLQTSSPRNNNINNSTSRLATFSSLTQQSSRRPFNVAGAHPLSERNFLLKSYQNSNFQGYYAFRIHGDQLDFGKLPAAFDQACSLYFREVDVSFRFLEKKAKDWRDQRREALAKREKMQESSSLLLPFGMVKDDINQPQPVHADPIRRILLDRHPLLGSENVLTQSPAMSVNNSQEDLSQFPDTTTAITTTNNNNRSKHHNYRSNSAGGSGRVRGYSEPVHPDELLLHMDDEVTNINNPPTVEGPYYNELDNLLVEDEDSYHNLPPWRQRELRERQEMQWAVDDDYWQKVECQDSIEARAAQYGLELCLLELVKPVDYESFDSVHQIEVHDEKRDATLFSIANASRTNVMWLESPSIKLKYEFLNWIAISLMDHGEIRLHLLEENMHSKREEIMETMKSLEDVLAQLENLDESAKKLSTTMLRAIENDEVQSCLQRSPATGLTLAETVDAKMKDVNERIVVCARIMGAARFNLNRLKYEIELEQRSMRLFRQYKIAIAVVTVSILLLFWLLYNRRHAAAAVAAAAEADAAEAEAEAAKAGQGFTRWSPFSPLWQ
ncbi:hypothetical protein BGZ97_009079 [Linnemannia gamsii]|uniref:Uncharacterized protein n=1 Tax=Linnemannia gamsii TaxID=64522 RepID=A0A9P6R8E2_9FUNG|nr:hypothetical protein BGZ97_009079 [Linnemannia gamsii]